MQRYNTNDKHIMQKLLNSKRFTKYPDMFLSNTCTVKVNPDDYFYNDEFTIECKNACLPRKIYLYGKKGRSYEGESYLYLNYWLPIFLKTIEKGYMVKNDFSKSSLPIELTIGLPFGYREKALNHKNWNRKTIIKFLSCLFNIEIYEANFEQQDLLETLGIAA